MIRIEQRDSARWIILDRPEVRNALCAELMSKAGQALAEGIRDTTVRSIVITGAGPVFSAGADLNEMKAMRGAPLEANQSNAFAISELFYAVTASPKPVIARVNGPAIAGALGIVAACDIAIAVSGISFAFTEARVGIVPAMISPFVIRRIGAARTQRLFLTAERFSAEEAERMGLVDRVVAPEALDNAVESLCRELVSCAPGALAEVKRLIAEVGGAPLDSHRRFTVELIARMRAGEEGQEGMAAFLEKRKPKWANA